MRESEKEEEGHGSLHAQIQILYTQVSVVSGFFLSPVPLLSLASSLRLVGAIVLSHADAHTPRTHSQAAMMTRTRAMLLGLDG